MSVQVNSDFNQMQLNTFDERLSSEPDDRSWLALFGGGGKTSTEFLTDTVKFQQKIIRKGDVIAAITALRGQKIDDDRAVVSEGKSTDQAFQIETILLGGTIGAGKYYIPSNTETSRNPKAKKARMRENARDVMTTMSVGHFIAQNDLARQSFIFAKQPSTLTNPAYEYDWKRATGNSITAGIAWDVQATATPMLDSQIVCDQVKSKGHGKVDTVLMSRTEFNSFRKSQEVLDAMNADILNRRVYIERNGPSRPPEMNSRYSSMIGDGWTYKGWFQTDDCEINIFIPWNDTIYDDYTDPDNPTDTQNIPAGTAIYFDSKKLVLDRIYGPPSGFDITSMEMSWALQRLGIAVAPRIDRVNGDVSSLMPRNSLFFSPNMAKSDKQVTRIDSESSAVFKTTSTDRIATLDGLET